VDLDTLADAAEGAVGVDLEALCREAALDAIHDTIRAGGADSIHDDTPLYITRKHCEKALTIWAARTHII
jgi:SpoVK/Ycf46/Vps4 family AAA+-type ATPase